MNNDLRATVSGFITGIAGILLLFHIVLPDWLSGLITCFGVVVLGYFTNKRDAAPKQGGRVRMGAVLALMGAVMFVLAIPLLCLAQTTPAPAPPAAATTAAPAPMPAPTPVPPPNMSTVFSGLGISPSVDTFMRLETKNPKLQSPDVGIGVNFIDYKQFLDLRLEVSQSATGSPFVGIGPVVNIPAIVAKINGLTWNTNFNVGLGILVGIDTGTRQFAWGPVIGFGWTF